MCSAYKRLMLGTNRPRRTSAPPEALEAIRGTNFLDMQLYAYAKKRFDQYIRVPYR